LRIYQSFMAPPSIGEKDTIEKNEGIGTKRSASIPKFKITPCHCANIVEVIYLPKNELVVVSTGYSIHVVVGKRERERERERKFVDICCAYIDNNNNTDTLSFSLI
jgi:hypothetical protein